MRRILEDYGNYAILVRNDKKQICKCVDRTSMAPKNTCQICLGTGYINSVEKVKIRNKNQAGSGLLSKAMEFADIGNVGVGNKEFFMEYTERPKKQDLLILCEWDGLNPVFDEYTQICKINNAEPIRGDNGRIEFLALSALSDPVDMTARFYNLQQNAGKLTYYITVR